MFTPSPTLLSDWSFGRSADRPIRIFASINTRCFGEFVTRLFYVNTVAQQFEKAAVTILYRNDRDFKQPLTKLLPKATTVAIPHDEFLPALDIISPRTVIPFPQFEDWHRREMHEQDLVITEGMATEAGLLSFERLGHLSIPEDEILNLTLHLSAAGVRRSWFVTMHARESGYFAAANNSYRNADQTAYQAAADHIISLGGQVVRLGHPEMTPWREREGLIQIGLEPNTALLQAFAVSRSRYAVVGPSGPVALAEAFGIPMAYANSWDLRFCNDKAVVRTVDLVSPSGEVFNQARIVDHIPHGIKPLLEAGWTTRQVDGSEMIRLADRIQGLTEGHAGWRVPVWDRAAPPNRLVWPGAYRPRGMWLEDAE